MHTYDYHLLFLGLMVGVEAGVANAAVGDCGAVADAAVVGGVASAEVVSGHGGVASAAAGGSCSVATAAGGSGSDTQTGWSASRGFHAWPGLSSWMTTAAVVDRSTSMS